MHGVEEEGRDFRRDIIQILGAVTWHQSNPSAEEGRESIAALQRTNPTRPSARGWCHITRAEPRGQANNRNFLYSPCFHSHAIVDTLRASTHTVIDRIGLSGAVSVSKDRDFVLFSNEQAPGEQATPREAEQRPADDEPDNTHAQKGAKRQCTGSGVSKGH